MTMVLLVLDGNDIGGRMGNGYFHHTVLKVSILFVISCERKQARERGDWVLYTFYYQFPVPNDPVLAIHKLG